jgi:prepilin-type N-terminal cleavage/methylation domain-containing protein
VCVRRAFTLVELLVVIAIMLVLMSIFLVVAEKARGAAYRTVCVSNIKQVGTAFLMYASDNGGYFPDAAIDGHANPADWIYWDGRNIKQSALWTYLGKSDRVLRCPIQPKLPYGSGSGNYYNYSYCLNFQVPGHDRDWPASRSFDTLNPNDKILVVEVAPETLTDGCWCPFSGIRTKSSNRGGQCYWSNYLSIRHDKRTELLEGVGASMSADMWTGRNGRGNVIFMDGHYEFFERAETLHFYHMDPKFSGPDGYGNGATSR